MESLWRKDIQQQKHKISLFQRYIQEARWPTCWTLKKQQMTNVLKKKKYNWIMKQRLHLRKIERGDLQWQKPHTHIRATSPISLMLTWENSESSTLEQHVNQHEKECSHDVLHIDNHRAENIPRWQSHFSSPCTVLHIQENVDFLLHEQNYSLELTQKFTWLINTNENLQSNIKQKLWEKDCTTKRKLIWTVIDNSYKDSAIVYKCKKLLDFRTYSGGAKTRVPHGPYLDQIQVLGLIEWHLSKVSGL